MGTDIIGWRGVSGQVGVCGRGGGSCMGAEGGGGS